MTDNRRDPYGLTPMDEPDWEEIAEGLVDAHDLLAAATLVEHVDPADAVAALFGLLRRLIESQRMTALVLRRIPAMSERVADSLDLLADTTEQLLPTVPARGDER